MASEGNVGGAVVMAERANVQHAIRRIGLNTIYQIGSQVAPAVAALAAIPFLLRHLGPELFGIVTILSTALLYFTMLDLGLGRAATRFIAQSLEAGRPDDLSRYFWGSILMLLAIGGVVALGGLLAVPTLVTKHLKVPPVYSYVAIKSFYLICITIPIVTLTATLRGFLEASGLFSFVSIVAGCGGVGTYVLPALVVSMGGGLVSIAASFVLVRVAMCLAFAAGCLTAKGRPGLRPIFDLVALRRMLSFGGWLSVSNIVGTAMIYCDRFLLGIWVGMAAVTSYGMPLDLIGRLQILITSFCAVLFPLMSRLDHSGSAQFQSLYRGAVAVTVSLMAPLATTVVVAAPFLMKSWLKERVTPDAVFAAQVFLAGAVVQSLASIAWTALHARGRSDVTAWVHLTEFPIYCGVFYLAATHYGVRGAAIAWLARVIADFLCMVFLLHMRGDGLGLAMPFVATAVCIGILFVAVLPWKTAGATAAAICVLTWVWTWRTLLDTGARTHLGRVLLGRRSAGAVV